MIFHSSHGIPSLVWSTCLLLLFAIGASAQSPETVVATVNHIEITQKQVDDSVAAQIYPLQQQLYAIRKAALENLITTKILESEAAAPRRSSTELSREPTLSA